MPKELQGAGDDDDDTYWTPDDFERELQIPKTTQATMRSRGQVPFLRLGGGRIIRYHRGAIREWVASRAVTVRTGGGAK